MIVEPSEPLVPGEPQDALDALATGDLGGPKAARTLEIASGCAATRARVKARKAHTRVRARWRTCGPLRRVRLRATFDASCDAIGGTFKAKRAAPVVFRALRSTCGDGIVDGGAGEECEADDACGSVSCTECRCAQGPTTSSSSTSTSTTLRATTSSTPASTTSSSTSSMTATTVPPPTSSTTTATTTPSATSSSSPTTSTTTSSSTSTTVSGEPPPDPAGLAPPIDESGFTPFADATRFLYEAGIQTGVAPGAVDDRRAAVLRGRVLDAAGAPLPAVAVTVLGRPGYGQTLSRLDGRFDLVVSGGEPLTLDLAKAGFLPAQRHVTAPWLDYAVLPDVVLLAADATVTPIALGHPAMQEGTGSETNDADGKRRAFFLVPPGTTAELVLPDGSTLPVAGLHVRVTEYTVGPDGPARMPAELPPTSGYTYAVEYSADEAEAAGAIEVQLSQPLIHYVENFLGLPVGSRVPAGWYDRARGAWMGSPDGLIVRVLAGDGGLADLDLDGDGAAESDAALAALGVSDDERARLATRYAQGTELWRVPVPHFTPWDHNFPFGPDPNDPPPMRPDPNPDKRRKPDPHDPCHRAGSIIECQDQVLGEEIPVTGSPFALHYRSDRVPGRLDDRTVTVTLSGPAVDPDLVRITFEALIAGQRVQQDFPPAPDQTHTFTWDGLDLYGRPVLGRRIARLRVGYTYLLRYQTPATFEQSWASISGVPFAGDRSSREVTLFQEWFVPLGSFDARALGLGGWTLGVQHALDPSGRLYLGDGSTRDGELLEPPVRTLATGAGPNGVGEPSAIAPSPDGGFHYLDGTRCLIRRRDPDGTFVTVAGDVAAGFNACGAPTAPTGGPATEATFGQVLYGLTRGPDGSLYVSDAADDRVKRVAPDGTLHAFAGTGTQGSSGDDGPAVAAELADPRGLAVGPDGSVYVCDGANHRLRRVGPDGRITTVAGTGTPDNTGDGGPAATATLTFPRRVAVAPDGTVYVVSAGRVRRIGTDGLIDTVPGVGLVAFPTSADDLSVGPDGTLYVAQDTVVLRVRTDGVVERVFGTGETCFDPAGGCGEGGPARAASAGTVSAIALGPQRDLLVGDSLHLLRTTTPPVATVGPGSNLVPSADGTEAFVFDDDGQHRQTLDALTGAVRWDFGYDGADRLVTLTDGDGNVTTIERSGATPTAIVAPGGQRTTLTLDADGYLASVTNPAGEAVVLTYHTGPASGLLHTRTDPKPTLHTYLYDALGRLESDTGPLGTTTLARSDTPDGYQVTLQNPAGLPTTYLVEAAADGCRRRARLLPTGALVESLVCPDGTQQRTEADGTVVGITLGPDPRWGMQVPILREMTITPPGGPTVTRTVARTATLATPNDPLSLVALTDTVMLDGASATIDWDVATRTLTTTSAEGRTSVVTTDALRRPVRHDLPGVAEPVLLGWNAFGRLETAAQGPRLLAFGYDAKLRLASRTNALGETLQLGRDLADRVTQVVLPSLATYGLGYDPNGNLDTVTMPGADEHLLAFDGADREVGYTPPGGTAFTFARFADGRPSAATLPGAGVEQMTYDAGGRPSGILYPEATVTVAYADLTERVDVLTRTPAGGGTAQVLDFAYQGDIPTGVAATGVAVGTFAWTRDADLLPLATTLTSGLDVVAVDVERDLDGLPTRIGPFTYTRTGPGGAPIVIDDGTGVFTLGYDDLGRLQTRALTVDGVAIYGLDLDWDAAGRLVEKVETVGGTTHTYSYVYDDDGQLAVVMRDGATVEEYGYDAHRNRASRAFGGGAAETATFDAQDRILTRGGVGYGVSAAGFLATRDADTFTYTTAGELAAATVGGNAVTYDYDGYRRRVARTDAGGTTQYLYGSQDRDLEVSAVRDPSGTLTWYHYDESGRLLALDRGGARFYVAVDPLGSPRVIADATGTIVRRLRHDAFGQVVEDTAPGFHLALGFAGGLADPVTGLVRFGFRDYDPETGRWTSRDPALFDGGQANLYAYVGNDPVDHVDQTGLFSIEVSAYEWIGVDGKIAITRDGISACAGSGFGFGGAEIGVDPFGDLDENGVALEGKLEVELGVVQIEVGGELSECANFKPESQVCVGPACTKPIDFKNGKPNGQLKLESHDPKTDRFTKLAKGKGQGKWYKVKAGFKVCQEARW